MNVRVHIERLILDGLPVTSDQGGLVRAAVESELTRSLAADELAPGLMTSGSVPRVPGGTIQLAGETQPVRLGAQIARAVHGGLTR